MRLGGIIFTNFVAWLTISVMSLMSMSGVPLPPYLEAILGLVLFPINALLNPVINTISTNDFKEAVTQTMSKVIHKIHNHKISRIE